MEKTKRELGANWGNSVKADCEQCDYKGKDCHPDDPEQFQWDCNEFKQYTGKIIIA